MERKKTLSDKPEKTDSGASVNTLDRQETQFRVKERLMDHMVYHVRTLSNAIVGFSDLLLSENLKSDQAEYVREIREAGYGLSSLVDEAMDWTCLLTGQLVNVKTRCYLPELMGRIENILASAAGEKGLSYSMSLDPRLGTIILCDSEHLFKCLLSVVSNAIRYTRQGSVQVCVRLDDGGEKPVVCFNVIDSGPGIAPEKIGRIFDPTWIPEESGPKAMKLFDRGLLVTTGLSLTKRFCEALGGTIEVASRINVGSTFSLRLPVEIELSAQTPADTTASAVAPPESPSAAAPRDPISILLAEDQPSNRTVITLMLEALGARVDTAQDGGEALEKAQQRAYDLILMDLKMPRMDGHEAARQIRQRNIPTPIMAMSAMVVNEEEQRAIAALFDGFLAKPVDSRKLAEMMTRFAASSSQTAADKEPVARFSANSEEGETITYEYNR
ncbi:MAG: response regulator [Planctomycetales bacterium]|nr:response regulator [Planctomycetales bacterium]